MSKWTNATLTADGQNLQAQLLDGGGFEFTKVTAADSSGTDKLTLTMQPSVIDGKTITVPVLLSNSNLSAGFTMNQLKFYARKTGIPAGDEIVYAIAEDETGDEIPSESDSPGFTIDWSYTFQFGNATSVNVSIDPAGLVSMALLGTPGGIATLNNAGAVPIEQGGTGAVTASAALAALGGMRASATGDDIPTSASDSTSISSQLSNRLRTPAEIPSGADLNDYTTAGMFYNPSTAQTVLNIPPNMLSGSFSLLVEFNSAYGNGCKQTFTDNNQGITYTRVMSDVAPGHWSEWKTLATATPPQEFDLPLAEEMQPLPACGSNKYWKNQFNEVTLTLSVTKTDMNTNDIPNGAFLATLPAGFRPLTPVSGAAYVDRGEDDNVYPGFIIINPDGSVRLFQAKQGPCSIVIASTSFVAAT